ncbi:AMP-binding protein [Kutzneria chonburiensis]|uniref:AMP-binding protein n=1 Tax=Kutzneria chonburiensis TaxID=1483604 RepID=A0ABV6N899_9PSEU|nr:AMP-binding protein [Kutzneria chonburiensis]
MQWLEDVLRRGWTCHRPAVHADGRTLSYAELLSAAAALAAELTETVSHHQLQALIVAGNSAEHLVADLATMIAGAATTALPPDSTEIRHTAAGADVVLCDADGRVVVDGLGLDRPIRTVDVREKPGVARPELPGDTDDARKVVVCPLAEREFALPSAAVDEMLRAVRLRAPTGVWRRYLALAPLSSLTEQTFVYLTLQHQGTVLLSNALHDVSAAQLTAPVAESLLRQHPELDGEDLCRALFGPTTPYLVCFDPVAPIDELTARGVPVHRGFAIGTYPITLAAQGTSGHSGEPLSHVWLKVADDGELMVKSKSHLIMPWRSADDGWLGLGVRGSLDTAGRILVG